MRPTGVPAEQATTTAAEASPGSGATDTDHDRPAAADCDIVTEDLTKCYGDHRIVEGIDLRVPRGSVYGFLGPNGAGKTTTMRMLAGLTRPTAGSGVVAGVPLVDRDRLGEKIGYMPESPPLYPELTGREQLECAAAVRGLSPDRASVQIDWILETFDLHEAAASRIETYSTGMRQAINLGQAVIHDPDVVFLDEPTSGFDPAATRTLRNLLRDLTAAGTTVFLSSHVLPVIEELADRIGILDDGVLVAEGRPATLRRQAETDAGRTPSLEAAFLAFTEQGEPTR